MSARTAFAIGVLLLVEATSGACVIGTEPDPGCHADADCAPGLTCRAGACFGVTTRRSPPVDPASDAGDAG